jgi:uncharacterized protein
VGQSGADRVAGLSASQVDEAYRKSKMRQYQKADLTKLHEIFAQYPEIQAVYLFGSAARGQMHAQSDLDLAIVSQAAALRQRKLEILTELARHGFCQVDLLFLDMDKILLAYEAVHQNILVYATEEFDRGEFYSRVVRQYLDFLPYLEVQRKAYKRRMLSGAS